MIKLKAMAKIPCKTCNATGQVPNKDKKSKELYQDCHSCDDGFVIVPDDEQDKLNRERYSGDWWK